MVRPEQRCRPRLIVGIGETVINDQMQEALRENSGNRPWAMVFQCDAVLVAAEACHSRIAPRERRDGLAVPLKVSVSGKLPRNSSEAAKSILAVFSLRGWPFRTEKSAPLGAKAVLSQRVRGAQLRT